MNRNTKTVIITVLVCLLVFGGVLVGLNWGRWFADAPETVAGDGGGGSGLALDPNAGEYVAPTAAPDSGSDGIAIPGWGSITIPAGETVVTVDFPNPEANAGKYYLSFELRLKDDSEQGYELLYASGLVEPGLHIQSITLSRALEAGNYAAVIHVQPYKMDEAQTATNNADMETELIVVD